MLLPWNLGALSPSPKSPRTSPITITTRLDKTSILVGDMLTYTIRVLHDHNIEFTLDNLKKNEISFSPFLVSDVAIVQGEWVPDKKRLEITLRLSSYEVGKTELTIPSFNLYYFKKEAGRRESTLAEAVKIPAVNVGLRSTLAGGQPKLRDIKPIAGIDLNRARAALILGLAGIGFCVVQTMRWVWRRRSTEKKKKKPPKMRVRERQAREDLDRIKALRGETPEETIRFFSEVSRYLRQYLGQKLGVELAGLTPEEIEAILGKTNFSGDATQQIRAILDQCDGVCYGREGLESGADVKSQVLEAIEKVLKIH